MRNTHVQPQFSRPYSTLVTRRTVSDCEPHVPRRARRLPDLQARAVQPVPLTSSRTQCARPTPARSPHLSTCALSVIIDFPGTLDTLVSRPPDGSDTMFRRVDAGFESTATGQRVGDGKVTVGGDGWRWVGHRSTGVGIGLELDAHTACGTRARGAVGQLLLVGLGDGERHVRGSRNQTPSAALLQT